MIDLNQVDNYSSNRASYLDDDNIKFEGNSGGSGHQNNHQSGGDQQASKSGEFKFGTMEERMFLHGSGAEHGGAVVDPFAG